MANFIVQLNFADQNQWTLSFTSNKPKKTKICNGKKFSIRHQFVVFDKSLFSAGIIYDWYSGLSMCNITLKYPSLGSLENLSFKISSAFLHDCASASDHLIATSIPLPTTVYLVSLICQTNDSEYKLTIFLKMYLKDSDRKKAPSVTEKLLDALQLSWPIVGCGIHVYVCCHYHYIVCRKLSFCCPLLPSVTLNTHSRSYRL